MDIKNIRPGALDAFINRVDNKTAAKQAERANEGTNTPRQGDRISLSDEAKIRTVALNAAMQAPEVRNDRLNAIRERVARGDYRVDSGAIAEKLLQEDAALESTVKG